MDAAPRQLECWKSKTAAEDPGMGAMLGIGTRSLARYAGVCVFWRIPRFRDCPWRLRICMSARAPVVIRCACTIVSTSYRRKRSHGNEEVIDVRFDGSEQKILSCCGVEDRCCEKSADKCWIHSSSGRNVSLVTLIL